LVRLLGDTDYPWDNVYAKKLNNGADLNIPTEGGTLARLEDLEGLGGGASLPDQTDNAGKFLTTDGATASWSDKPLVNLSNAGTGIVIGTKYTGFGNNGWSVALGYDASATNSSVAIGHSAKSESAQSVAIGRNATVQYGDRSIAIGYNAKTTAKEAYQIGYGTNSERGTLYVGLSADDGATWQNHKLLDKYGNVPLERLTYVTDQIGDISTALTAILGE
jgi:hypothetical protein